MKPLFVILLVLVILDGCVDRLPLPEVTTQQKVIVDAMVTEGAGPHFVKLHVTSPIGTNLENATPLTNATVMISDNVGNMETLTQTSAGVYQSRVITGIVGRSYKLTFITAQNKRYESPFEEMHPAGSMENLRFEYRPNSVITGDVTQDDAMAILVDSRGVDNERNFFRWRWSGIYEVETYPHLRTRVEAVMGGPPVVIPDPLPCSGYIVNNNQIQQVDECECCNCWVSEHSSQAIVSNNAFVSQTAFNNIETAELTITRARFFKKYYVEVEQLSLSESAYNFWRNVQLQANGSQNIFQPNIIRIRGNMTCVTDPTEEVAGVFSVSAITRIAGFIPRNLIDRPVLQDSVKADCRVAYDNSTNVKPPFW